MVSAKSRRGLIKALSNATGATKGNRCFIRFNKPILLFTFAINDSICSYIYAHSKSHSYEWQQRDTWLNLRSQGFRDQWQAWYLRRFSTCYHHQTIRTCISMYLRSDSCCLSILQHWQGQHSGGIQYFDSNAHWSKSLCRLHTWLLASALNSWEGR